MTESDDPRDRRIAERQDGHFPCQLSIDDADYEGTTRNLSLGGLLLELSDESLPELMNKEGTITVVIGSIPYSCDCVVVRVSDEGIGIRFGAIQDSALEEVIFDFISGQLDDL